MIRTLFPQITEAPLYFYATQADSASIRTVADQCAETGFEAIILSFGSGFNPSSTNASYIAQMAKDVTLFLCWTAEPEHDERKKAGIKIMAGLTLAAIAAGWYKRFLWSPLKSRKISFH